MNEEFWLACVVAGFLVITGCGIFGLGTCGRGKTKDQSVENNK